MFALVLLISTVATTVAASPYQNETSLFIQLDTHWKHNESGDAFVARTDIKNIGNYTAHCVLVKLEDIPDDWDIEPCCHYISQLPPGDTTIKYFVIERGDTDSPLQASAQAINAQKVLSNKIAIPVFPGVVALLSVVCAGLAYVHVKKQKKQH